MITSTRILHFFTKLSESLLEEHADKLSCIIMDHILKLSWSIIRSIITTGQFVCMLLVQHDTVSSRQPHADEHVYMHYDQE